MYKCGKISPISKHGLLPLKDERHSSDSIRNDGIRLLACPVYIFLPVKHSKTQDQTLATLTKPSIISAVAPSQLNLITNFGEHSPSFAFSPFGIIAENYSRKFCQPFSLVLPTFWQPFQPKKKLFISRRPTAADDEK